MHLLSSNSWWGSCYRRVFGPRSRSDSRRERTLRQMMDELIMDIKFQWNSCQGRDYSPQCSPSFERSEAVYVRHSARSRSHRWKITRQRSCVVKIRRSVTKSRDCRGRRGRDTQAHTDWKNVVLKCVTVSWTWSHQGTFVPHIVKRNVRK